MPTKQKPKLVIFNWDNIRREDERTGQGAFFDELEDLLEALNEAQVDVVSVVHNTRTWLAVIKELKDVQ